MTLVLQIFISLVWWVALFPVAWVLSTPLILLLSLQGNGTYLEKVRNHYQRVTAFWKEWGILLVP